MQPVIESYASSSPYPLALEGGERWYVVRTQPHREAQAARQLENQAFRVFLPRFFKSRRQARKFETVLAPLFPRYLFIVLDLRRDRWRSVNGTFGVDRLLMRAGEPEPVPRGLVEQLAFAANANSAVRFSLGLKEGQTVRLTAGPFAELMGKIESLDDQGRVRILLEIMGGTVPVVLSGTIVSPI
ncbi:MAG TPA: transcription termination/antitermination NusG family protein [Methyloceanibacter sp.]|jgi:transcriptional antiterminator RfaH|nr:transcription termination/antitermination NusG family protein [Methyloceanibacter sp.]